MICIKLTLLDLKYCDSDGDETLHAMLQQVEPECAEELGQVVAPWQLTLRQLSAGALQPCITFTALNDILISNDRWQGSLHGTGATAAGHITVLGGFHVTQIPFNGTVIAKDSLVYALGDAAWDFCTPHGTNHWVMMLPEEKLAGHMGLEPSELLDANSLLLHCDPQQSRAFESLARQILVRDGSAISFKENRGDEAQLEAMALSLVADMLSSAPINGAGITTRARYSAYRKAIRYIEKHDGKPGPALTIQDLATASGVSVRVLQLSFREHLGYSPYRFMRLCRLNQLHAALRESKRPGTKVTQLMEQHGFTEFGRSAGEYKRVFGEPPLKTLTRSHQSQCPSIVNATGS